MKRFLIGAFFLAFLSASAVAAASDFIGDLDAVPPGRQGVCVTELAGGERRRPARERTIVRAALAERAPLELPLA